MGVGAFLVYHLPHEGKHLRFVDELLVLPEWRGRGVATRLLQLVASGPIELRVHRSNVDAISLYTKLGMRPSGCIYGDSDDESLCMRTSSFWETKRRIVAALRGHEKPKLIRTTYTKWNEIPLNDRKLMIQELCNTHNYSSYRSMRNLKGEKNDNMVYVLLRS